jgi:hypothetical protein
MELLGLSLSIPASAHTAAPSHFQPVEKAQIQLFNNAMQYFSDKSYQVHVMFKSANNVVTKKSSNTFNLDNPTQNSTVSSYVVFQHANLVGIFNNTSLRNGLIFNDGEIKIKQDGKMEKQIKATDETFFSMIGTAASLYSPTVSFPHLGQVRYEKKGKTVTFRASVPIQIANDLTGQQTYKLPSSSYFNQSNIMTIVVQNGKVVSETLLMNNVVKPNAYVQDINTRNKGSESAIKDYQITDHLTKEITYQSIQLSM